MIESSWSKQAYKAVELCKSVSGNRARQYKETIVNEETKQTVLAAVEGNNQDALMYYVAREIREAHNHNLYHLSVKDVQEVIEGGFDSPAKDDLLVDLDFAISEVLNDKSDDEVEAGEHDWLIFSHFLATWVMSRLSL